jgi:hypothetical protein
MLRKGYFKNTDPWDLYARLILLSLAVLQISRWPSLPQFLDIYYHLQVAWGFIQAGGYSAWDFWEYAPFGRVHLYPPLFHFLLAGLIKAGFNLVLLAKFFESVTPVLFLLVLWNFIRKNYSRQLGFFTVIALGSSFTFHISLANHVPSSLALILGFLSFGEFFKKRYLRAVILLVLCFYTHNTVPWFFALSYIFYAVLEQSVRPAAVKTVMYAILLALPILIVQLLNLRFIHLVGNSMLEKFHLQIKVFDCMLAGFGLFLASRSIYQYKFFIGLFLSSFIFLPYPARFLSAEGYIPVVLFSALALQFIWQRLTAGGWSLKKLLAPGLIICVFFISPVLFVDKPSGAEKIRYRLELSDAVFTGLCQGRGDSVWYPWAYLPAAGIISANSNSQDIVYSELDVAGLILSSLAQRASANGLLPETRPDRQADAFAHSDIIVLPQDLEEEFISGISNKYNLIKVGQTEYFSVFRNPAPVLRLKIAKAAIDFWVITAIILLLAGLFWNSQLLSLFLSLRHKFRG